MIEEKSANFVVPLALSEILFNEYDADWNIIDIPSQVSGIVRSLTREKRSIAKHWMGRER